MSTKECDLFLEELLPLRHLVITLEFTEATRLRFFHQPSVTAFLRTLLGQCEPYDQLFVVDTPESGRCSYQRGEYYRFSLIALDGADRYLDILLAQLARLPASVEEPDRPLSFRDNVRLVSVQDAFTGHEVHHLSQVSLYDTQQLTEEALLWQQNCSTLDWRWISPARLYKEKTQKEQNSGDAQFCHDAGDLSASLLLNRLYDSVASLIKRRSNRNSQRQAPPEIQLEYAHLFWIDSEYKGREGSKPIGGASGLLRFTGLEGVPLSWWRLLIVGQFIGIGARRAFGLGRYQLINEERAFSFRRVLPAHPLLERVADADNLHLAYKTVVQNQGGKLPSGPVIDDSQVGQVYDQPEPLDDAVEKLQRFVRQMSEGRYSAQILQGWLLAKPNGGYRALAVPPFWDRILQRAVAQVITPDLDQIMDGGSYGYRRGRSRYQARDAINKAIRAGYQWVFESDIQDFFDSVQHSWLEIRLRALYGEDPIVPMLLQWMAADVSFEGELIERKAGLPQGSPLSPVLANLVLDDFDADMRKAGFRLVRFADDFVVMCKSPAQAKKAQARATTSLEEHGLQLNAEKTHIRHAEQGLKYLGFLFVNDLVLDVGGQKAAEKRQDPSDHPWLAQLAERDMHSVTVDTNTRTLSSYASPKPQINRGERDESGAVICVTGPVSVVSTHGNRVRITRDDTLVHEQAWSTLQALVLFGNHHITTPALRAAMAQNVCVHMADGMGKYQGTAWGGEPLSGHDLWLKQQQVFGDPSHCLRLARDIVKNRLLNMVEVLRNRTDTGHKEIRLLARQLERAKDLKQLNGYEGSAAARYFRVIATLLPDSFEFDGRNRQPPKDPFNVLLSLGYSMLYGYTDSMLRVAGLLPWQGFYHQPRGLHRALASDLMEPFRHLVERKALAMVRKGQINRRDFYHTSDGRCVLEKQALRLYLAELTTALESDVSLRGQGKEASQRLTSHLRDQNNQLIEYIRSHTRCAEEGA